MPEKCLSCRRSMTARPSDIREGPCTNEAHFATQVERDALAFAMFCGWINIDPASPAAQSKIVRFHECHATAVAWGRVANAARAHIAAEQCEALPTSREG